MKRESLVWIVDEKQDFVARLEPRFCGCFCGVHAEFD